MFPRLLFAYLIGLSGCYVQLSPWRAPLFPLYSVFGECDKDVTLPDNLLHLYSSERRLEGAIEMLTNKNLDNL